MHRNASKIAAAAESTTTSKSLKRARPYRRRNSYQETGLLLRNVPLTYHRRENIVITTVYVSSVPYDMFLEECVEIPLNPKP